MRSLAFLPEIGISALAFLLLFLVILGVKKTRVYFYLSLVGILLNLPLLFIAEAFKGEYFNGSFILDSFALFFKLLFLIIVFLVFLLSGDFLEQKSRNAGEYYSLLLWVTVGLMVLVSAGDLLTLFIALEMVSIPLYILSAFAKSEQASSEAGLKYFFLGAFASGIFLYGISLFYGSIGSLSFQAILAKLQDFAFSPALILGMLCMATGLGFKIAAVPFHMWAPDVYQGAPNPVVAFISVAPKTAGIAVLIRLFLLTLPGLAQSWTFLFLLLSALSMLVGNLAALPQTNFKRMLAFSGISHIGYLLLGVAAANLLSVTAVLFYLGIYALTNLGAFAVLILVSRLSQSEEIADFTGLARRSPALAFILLLTLLSLAGAPPLSGFVAKFLLFFAAFMPPNPVFKYMVLFAILNSVVSLYYYLGVLRVAYFEKGGEEKPITLTAGSTLVLSLAFFGTVVLGLLPVYYQWVLNIVKGLGLGG